jgi:hypothetical protein
MTKYSVDWSQSRIARQSHELANVSFHDRIRDREGQTSSVESQSLKDDFYGVADFMMKSK